MDMYIGIATKMIVGGIGIFVLLRLLGKKPMSELTPFDLIYIVVLGALVEESIYDHHVNILHIIFAITLWGAFVYIIEKLLESTEKVSTLIEGEPSVLIDQGRLNMKELNANHFDMEQLRTVLRVNHCYSINDCYYAVLEVNGAFTIIKKDEMAVPSLLLIEEGTVVSKTLAGLDKDESWLRSKLSEEGYHKVEDILYCEWDKQKEEMYVGTYDHTINKKIYLED